MKTRKRLRQACAVFGCLAGLMFIGTNSAYAGVWRENTDAWWAECNSWCNAQEACDHCSTHRHCGGYEVLRSWTGYGNDTFACGRRDPDLVGERGAASIENREACEAWCRENADCVRCSTIKTCGPGLARMRSWVGRGRNWHACRRNY